MTGRAGSGGIAGLVLGLAAFSITCESTPPEVPSSPCLAVPACSDGATGSASAAECSLTTEVVSSADRGATGIALDDRNVYLKNARGVFVAPKAGGPLAPFDGVAPSFAPSEAVRDGAYEYRASDGRWVTVAVPEAVDDECFAMTRRQGALYWTADNGVLKGAPLDTGSPWELGRAGASDCDDDYDGLAVAADDTGIYWIAGTPGERTSDEKPLTLYRTCRSDGAATN